jgi:hypothetical protein
MKEFRLAAQPSIRRPKRSPKLWIEQLENRNMPGETMLSLAIPLGLAPLGDLFDSARYAVTSDSPSASASWADSAVLDTSAKGEAESLAAFDANLADSLAGGSRQSAALGSASAAPATDFQADPGSWSADELSVAGTTSFVASNQFMGVPAAPISGAGLGQTLAILSGAIPAGAPAYIPASADSRGAAATATSSAASADASGGSGAAPMLHVLPRGTGGAQPNKGPKGGFTPAGYSPAQMKHAYGFDQLSQNGSGQTIFIIDAFDQPNITKDLNTFSSQFGLPSTTSGQFTFSEAFPSGTRPQGNISWGQEISLDVEWAHAIAPNANITLVEAASNSFTDLYGAVDYAVSHGARIVSMSWGASEYSSETSDDVHFNQPGVVFLASSGDSGGVVEYPSVSPYVVAVGGTSLPLDKSGNLTGAETAWSGGGGGTSTLEAIPGYQTSFGISNLNNKREVPDVSYNADPNTGVAVYDSYGNIFSGRGWLVFGGTSAGAPQWAALVALADQGRVSAGKAVLASSNLTTSPLYNSATGAAYSSNYRDITSGSNGFPAVAGYDLATGLGSPLANNLVPYLINN